MFDQIIFWCAQADEIHSSLRVVGVFGRWLRSRRSGVVTSGGFRFFPDRAALGRDHGTIGNRFVGVSSVEAIWVVGQDYIFSGEKTDVVKKLLLPNPDDQAVIHAFKTTNVAESARYIREATARAIQGGTKVRWYDNFLYHSIILADTDKPSGWIHVESILPYSKTMKRPSWTLYKRQSPETVMEMKRIFDEIWDSAKVPT